MKSKKIKFNFKSKWFWLITIIVAIVLVVVFIPKGEKAPSYETTKVEKGKIEQTVDATGKIESADKISLNFQMSGNISRKNVKEGDKVSAGQLLASLSSLELDAAVAQAQASLNQKLAGSTVEQIDVAQKQVDSAKVAYEKAKTSLNDVTTLGETSLNSKYSYALTSLSDVNLKIYNTFTSMTSIRDNYFNGSDQQGLVVQNAVKYKIGASMDAIKVLVDNTKNGDRLIIDNAIVDVIVLLDKVYDGLNEIRDACDNSGYKNIPDSITASVDSQKSIVSASKASIVALQSEINSLKVQNERDKNNAEAAIESAKASLDIQEASLKSIKAGPREVDVAYYEAALSQAKANRAKAFLYAPISGIVSKVNKDVGELVSIGDVFIELISPHYEIKIDIPETDVVKIEVADEVEITFDALGSDIKFKGYVMTIEPSSTEIQDVVYYKVRISLDDGDKRVKPGMTANVLINTDKKEDVLYLPNRAVLSDVKEGRKYVKVLNNGQVIEKNVVTGIKGDGGIVEIVSGLNQGEEVILKTNK
ncbi:MAG: efflux RND transporter periplasmic adaptor subunit [Candidatus Pacebacteria bacterium]|nr:efflux RND transporter periplasmic adaptor subunit [Candidatus Paceibacterota bacterium]